jgi:phosphatidylglycerol:prolipoprotein diacylglycerol transferase
MVGKIMTPATRNQIGSARSPQFAREPDDFLDLPAFGISMGQWLSAPMLLAGAAMLAWAYRDKPVGGIA